MIEANELRIKGIKAIESEIKDHGEAMISYRGKARYIVLPCDEYNKLRAAELDALYLKAKKEIEAENVERIENLSDLQRHIASL